MAQTDEIQFVGVLRYEREPNLDIAHTLDHAACIESISDESGRCFVICNIRIEQKHTHSEIGRGRPDSGRMEGFGSCLLLLDFASKEPEGAVGSALHSCWY
jgi:hypothetical protein